MPEYTEGNTSFNSCKKIIIFVDNNPLDMADVPKKPLSAIP